MCIRDSISAFNRESLHLYGTKDAYQATIAQFGKGMPSSMFSGSVWQTVRLIPFMLFWLLWPNWGATLYGEVRGAKDFRKNIYQMGGGLLSAAHLVDVLAEVLGAADLTIQGGAPVRPQEPEQHERDEPHSLPHRAAEHRRRHALAELRDRGLIGVLGTVQVEAFAVEGADAVSYTHLTLPTILRV